MHRCRIFWLLAALMLFGASTGCERKPIQIGFSGQLTGSHSDLGVQGRNGARLAVDEINTGGGIRGRRLKLVVRDDQGTPEGAIQSDQELAALGVCAIIGHMTGSLSLAALPVARKTGIPLISPVAAVPALTRQKDLFFQLHPGPGRIAASLATMLVRRNGTRTVAVIQDDRNKAYSEAWTKAFADRFTQLSGKIPAILPYTRLNDETVDRIASTVEKLRVDAVVLIASAADTLFFLNDFERRGILCPFYVTEWAQTDTLLAGASPFGDRLFIATDIPPTDATDRLRGFAWKFKQRYGIHPTDTAIRSYDAVYLIAEALRRSGWKEDSLAEILTNMEHVEGLYGPIRLDPYGDNRGTFYLLGVRKERFVVLTHLDGGRS